MSYREIFSVLAELYLKGGLEVSTFSASNSTGRGKTDASLLIRTVIQADGDMITFLSQHALREANAWQVHLDQLGDRIRKLRLLRIVPEMLVSLVSTSFLLLTGIWYQCDRAIIATALWAILLCGAIALVMSGAHIVAKGMKKGFRKDIAVYIRRVFLATKVPEYLLRVVNVGVPLAVLLYKGMILIGLLVPLVLLSLKPAVWCLFRRYLRCKTG